MGDPTCRSLKNPGADPISGSGGAEATQTIQSRYQTNIHGTARKGFARRDHARTGLERARAKRRAKNADLFVYNDVSRPDIGFDSTENEVVVVSENGDRHVAKAPKRVVAAAVLDEVERLLSKV